MERDDLRRYGAALEGLLASKELTRREVEVRLGWSRGALSKLLQGKNELKVRSLLDILNAIGVAPLDFYTLVHGAADARPAEAPIASRILTSFGSPEREVGRLTLPRDIGRDELEDLIETVVRRILSERS
jgi:transcriptional regulator with XRE-family HTH domain